VYIVFAYVYIVFTLYINKTGNGDK